MAAATADLPRATLATSAGSEVEFVDDDDADGDASAVGDGPVLRKTSLAIKTIGDAVAHVEGLMEAQVGNAIEQRAPANVSIVGDSAARNTFYTLLPDQQQRAIFQRVASQMRAWPRLRPLFGAPPYGFLHAEDAGMLRATGIAPGRSNMAHNAHQMSASYTQFGAGQLVDELAREYRVMRRYGMADDDPLPCNLDVRDTSEVMLQVRLRKRSRSVKTEMMRDAAQRERLMFPRPGQRITLKETKRILSLQGLQSAAATRTTLQVKRVLPRSLLASTAALVAIVV